MIMYVLKIKLIIFHLVKYEKRIINNMIFTEKDSMILNKKKLNLLYLKLKSLKARVKHTKKEIRKFKEDNRIP